MDRTCVFGAIMLAALIVVVWVLWQDSEPTALERAAEDMIEKSEETK